MAPLGGSPATVLVADDDPLVRTVLRMALAGMGATVVEARTTSEVVRFDAERAIDLVILDLNMPGGAVTESIDALASRDPRPRILLLSGEDAPPALDRVDGFARKPIELIDFTRIVKSLLDGDTDGGGHDAR